MHCCLHCYYSIDESALEVSRNIIITLFDLHVLELMVAGSARPIFVTIEFSCGLHARSASAMPGILGLPGYSRGLLKCSIRVLLIVVITLLAVLVPSFDVVMALMGSAMCFNICIVLPLSFYLKIFGSEISRKERVFDWFLIIVCLVLAIMGTVWAFLPKSLTGAR